MWSLVIGFVSATFIIPILQQPHWSSRTRALLTFAYCIVVGIGNVFFQGEFDLKNLATSILLIFVSAIATYKGFSRPTGVAPAIETATSPNPQ
jgi:biotin transporter BioY